MSEFSFNKIYLSQPNEDFLHLSAKNLFYKLNLSSLKLKNRCESLIRP